MSATRQLPSTVLVAPDSFKGTFSAAEVADAIARGLRAEGLPVDLCPVADGGEGTLNALREPLALDEVHAVVSDPLGRPVQASFGVGRDSPRGEITALVEVAAASGLDLVPRPERDAVKASSFGTGELILHAVAREAGRVYLAAGGSATTDGGAGAIQAIRAGGGLVRTRLVVLCDVRTPWEQAARVFAPQKGAGPGEVRMLTRRLAAMARRLPRDPRGIPMTGAAGGLAGGLWAEFGAELVAGGPFVLDAVSFDARMRAAKAVVTGEGRLDETSLSGKAVSEVATRARQAGVPCYAVAGSCTLDHFGQRVLDLQPVLQAGTLAELQRAGAQLAGLISV